MKLTKTERLILYSLGQFYAQLTQPLQEKPIHLRTSKIACIAFLLHSNIIVKKERALYKNLEELEKKKLLEYQNKMITFTEKGILVVKKINKDVEQFIKIEKFFSTGEKPKRKLQTVIRS